MDAMLSISGWKVTLAHRLRCPSPPVPSPLSRHHCQKYARVELAAMPGRRGGCHTRGGLPLKRW